MQAVGPRVSGLHHARPARRGARGRPPDHDLAGRDHLADLPASSIAFSGVLLGVFGPEYVQAEAALIFLSVGMLVSCPRRSVRQRDPHERPQPPEPLQLDHRARRERRRQPPARPDVGHHRRRRASGPSRSSSPPASPRLQARRSARPRPVVARAGAHDRWSRSAPSATPACSRSPSSARPRRPRRRRPARRDRLRRVHVAAATVDPSPGPPRQPSSAPPGAPCPDPRPILEHS